MAEPRVCLLDHHDQEGGRHGHLVTLPVVARTLMLAPVISALMTYAALPLVTRLLRRWLFR